MKTHFISSLLSSVLFCFLALGCTSKSGHEAHPTSEKKNTPEAEVWTCPMHPKIRKETPGKCPICGMTLVKAEINVSAESDSTNETIPDEHAPITLSLSRQQMIGVKTGIAEKKPVFKLVRAAGRLAFDPELYTAQNEYTEALRQLHRVKDSPLPDVKHSALRMVQSSKLRLKVLGLSDQQIDSLALSKSDITSDSRLLINKPGQQVWVYADIYEIDLPYIQPGLSAEISAGFLGGKILPGKVASVDRVINPNTRTAKARILVRQAATLLRPEAYVDVSIMAPLNEQVTVPFDSVLDTGKQSWVFVVDDDGQFTPRVVSIKFQAGDDIAIASGLTGGEKIVTSANFLIDSESRLKAVSTGQTGTKEAPAHSTTLCEEKQHWDHSMAMCMPD